jgi:hypothetical protein
MSRVRDVPVHDGHDCGKKLAMSASDLKSIPVVDARDGGPVRHAHEACVRARALRDDCIAWFPRATHPAVPLLDAMSRRWLSRSRSPYVEEIAAIAAELKFPGIWFLNSSYQWGCTSLGREEDGVPWLVRTLDWPYPGLGRHVEVARAAGPAGEFCNVTWPGYVGVLTATALGRFAACLNQAPLWRRTRHAWLRLYDISLNAVSTWWLTHIPPDQLLRQVFEQCRTFQEARHRLETTPIARPAIFTLVGCRKGERCVIERTQEGGSTREEPTGAANDWLVPAAPWEARVGGDLVMTCTSEEATERSRRRREALDAWRGSFVRESFSWVVPPVLNRYTRLAAEMCPASGTLRVVGYELAPGGETAQAVTLPCQVTPALTA